MRRRNQGVTIVLSCDDRKRLASFIQILMVIDKRVSGQKSKQKKQKNNRVRKKNSDECMCCPCTVKQARSTCGLAHYQPTSFALFRRVGYQVISRVMDILQ